MPLYSNKMPIESLGGNCILWRARFESAANQLRCTIPPAQVEVTNWYTFAGNDYAGSWEITVDAPGELDLLSFDISHNEQPATGRGFPDAVMISVWFQNTSIRRTYARQTA